MREHEKLMFPEIRCASDRGGCVVFGNRYFQYMADVISPGDGKMFVKIIDYEDWRKLRDNDKRFSYDRIKELGTLEGHFYLYDNDCSHGNKEEAIVEFDGTFYLYDFCDEYHPTLYVISGLRLGMKKKYKVKILRKSPY